MPTFTARTPEPPSSDTRPNSPLSNLIRHPNYYLPGGDLFIQVIGTLFRVHSYFFIRESMLWHHLLRNTTQGLSARDPIILHHEFELSPFPTPEIFASFLYVFYNPYYSVYDLSAVTWWNIESYAQTFGMRHVEDLVHREQRRIERRRPRSLTHWLSLSLTDGSDAQTSTNIPTSIDEEHWPLSETPYDEWISDPEFDDEVSLLLNRRHLEDGRP
jgi:hypothetical protein